MLSKYQTYKDIFNASDFKTRAERRFLRNRLNGNPESIIFNGNDFDYSNLGRGSDGRWSRWDVRRMTKLARRNMKNAYSQKVAETGWYGDLTDPVDSSENNPGLQMIRDTRDYIFGLRGKGLKAYTFNWNAYENPEAQKYQRLALQYNPYSLYNTIGGHLFGEFNNLISMLPHQYFPLSSSTVLTSQAPAPVVETTLLLNFDNMPFKLAFKTARASGAETFVWRGAKYTTELGKNTLKTPIVTNVTLAVQLDILSAQKSTPQEQPAANLSNTSTLTETQNNQTTDTLTNPVQINQGSNQNKSNSYNENVAIARAARRDASRQGKFLFEEKGSLPYSVPTFTYYSPNDEVLSIQDTKSRSIKPRHLLHPFAEEYQQGGSIGASQEDQEEQLVLRGILGYIGANPDKDIEESLQTVLTAYIQDPESLTDIVKDENLAKKGASVLQLKYPDALKQLSLPGTIKKMISSLSKQVKSAKMGTKLEYIKELKRICPDGYELVYMKRGGTVCPVCGKKHTSNKLSYTLKVEKDKCGSKVMKKIKEEMKCGGKMKKKENGGEVNDKEKKPIQYTPVQRDSMILLFNKRPDSKTYERIQLANRLLAEWDDLHPNQGEQINQKVLNAFLALKKSNK